MKFINKKLLALFIIFGILIVSCSKEDIIDEPEEPTVSTRFNTTTDRVVLNHEFRAAWLTTAYKLDWPGSYTNATEQQNYLISLIDKIYGLNMNVVLFQAMTSSAAFYRSTILPWTDYLTGTQGQDPGYDPLQVAINAAHAKGMELHVWMNPLRVGSATGTYASNHPAVLHPTWYSTYAGVRYWNAGLPEVRQHLRNVVKEVIEKYDIDGIHFDDYFYPDGLKSTPGTWDDSQAFALYGNGLTLNQWRERNIDLMVQGIYDEVKANDNKVLFGISPSGQIANSLALYANPITWLTNKWVDYLAPQMYWQIGHATADFSGLASYWHANSSGVGIIPGIAAYRLGESGFPNISEFLNEVKISRSYSTMRGNCWFRTEHITTQSQVGINTISMSNYIKTSIYKYKSLVPKLGVISQSVPSVPSVTMNQTTLSWNDVANATEYAVYVLERDGTTSNWDASMVYKGTSKSYIGTSKKNYIVIALNGREKSTYQQVLYIQ